LSRVPRLASARGAVLAAVTAAFLAAPASAAGATLTAAASPPALVYGSTTTISGKLSDDIVPVGGQTVQLAAKPYGATAFTPVTSKMTNGDGSYSFPNITPDRNTVYQVTAVTPPATSDPVPVTVSERTSRKITYLPLGKVRIVIGSRHPQDLKWGGKQVYWFLAEGSSNRFKLVKKTKTAQPQANLTTLGATFPVAGGKFRFLECFVAPNQAAMGPADAHPKCHTGNFSSGSVGKGKQLSATFYGGAGSAPFGFPYPNRIASARRYISHRSGIVSFAVVDSEGRISGSAIHRTYVSASVVKAMLLTAYLRKLAAEHRGLDSGSRSILYPMIHVSDNSAATAVWQRVGNRRLYNLAHLANMTDFSICCIWASAHFSAADQAKFMFKIDDLLPRQFRSYARGLLAGIAGFQSWGIPHVARPAWHVLFKGGWRGTGRGQLVHQVARLERRHAVFSLAVLTDGDPSMGYGISTIQGVTAKLLSGRNPKEVMAQSLGPGGG
jgi:hypothetical protein